MALVIPFRALRPHKKYAGEVASFPYDVLDREEGRAIIRDNPRNFLRVEKSEIDLPDEIRDDDPRVFAKAHENLRNFMSEGILFQEDKPSFYVYRQKTADREQYGLVGCVSVAEYEAGLIKKHELTRFDKENERVNHINTAGAQTGLVFLLYRSREAIDRIISGIVKGPPEYDFTTSDGVTHTAWVVGDSGTIETLQKEFSKVECLYIADGHHRAASAATVARMRREKNPAHVGTEEYNYFVATLFSHEQLKILDYNRVVKDLRGMTVQELLEQGRGEIRCQDPASRNDRLPGPINSGCISAGAGTFSRRKRNSTGKPISSANWTCQSFRIISWGLFSALPTRGRMTGSSSSAESAA